MVLVAWKDHDGKTAWVEVEDPSKFVPPPAPVQRLSHMESWIDEDGRAAWKEVFDDGQPPKIESPKKESPVSKLSKVLSRGG